MCLIVAFIATVYAISSFYGGHYASGSVGAIIALFFTALLIKNIMDVKKIRHPKQSDNNKEES